MKRPQLRRFDLKHLEGVSSLIGVDEAGRGALAGPVVAAAVLVDQAFVESRWAQSRSNRVNDSKQVTPEVRDALFDEMNMGGMEGLFRCEAGVASVEEIEQYNILGATKLAMRRALEAIYPPELFHQRTEPDLFSPAEVIQSFRPQVSCRVLIDGLALKNFPYPHQGVVRGDARSFAIALASIKAKVTRDRLMIQLDAQYPGYGFAQHKGYGTEEHRDAVLRRGRCSQHREMFLRKLLAQRVDPSQMDFLAADDA